MDLKEYVEGLTEKCKQSEKPITASFELTPFCNFRCNMCYIRLNPKEAALQGKELTTEQWIQIAKESKKMGVLSVEVTGGEAVTRPDFPILYKSFAELGFLIILRSNGYLVSKQILELLCEFKPYRVLITMYGASDETYRKICGVRDGFTVVSSNILALKKAGIKVELTVTMTKENSSEVGLIQQWAADQGLPIKVFGFLLTPIRGAKRSIDSLKVPMRDEKDCIIPADLEPRDRIIPNRDHYLNPYWMCRCFGARFSISWDGRIVLCCGNHTVWKDPIKSGLNDAYHDLYRELKSIKRPKECETCQYLDFCPMCPAQLFSATGRIDRVNEDVCKYARKYYKRKFIDNKCAINTEQEQLNEICEEV